MEIDFGGCLNATYEEIRSSTFEFLMRLLTKFRKKRAVQIASHLVWDVVGVEVGRMLLVLVDAKQKALGVVLMMVVLEEPEAEAGLAKVESLEEAEVLGGVEDDLSK